MIHYGAKSQTMKGPVIRINCPRCGSQGVEAETGDIKETTSIFFIPVSRGAYTLVKCLKCKTQLLSKLPTTGLLSLTPQELEGVLRIRPDLVGASVAVFAIMISLFPIVGPACAIWGVLLNRKSPRWNRILAWVGLGISLVLSNLALYLFAKAGG